MKCFALLIQLLLSTIFCLSQGTWVQKANFPGSFRTTHVNFTLNNLEFIGGGFMPEVGPELYDFWSYDPVTDSWNQHADLPPNLICSFALTIGDTAYFFSFQDSIGTTFIKCWRYNYQQDNFTLQSEFAIIQSTYICGGFAINQKGYVIFNHQPPLLYEYDPVQNLWTEKNDLLITELIDGFTAFPILDKGYIFEYSSNQGYPNKLWEWNSVTDTWQQKASLPAIIRFGSASFSFNDRGYVMGGLYDNYPFVTLNDFWMYNPQIDSWSQLADFGGWGRGYAIPFVIGDIAYIGLGVGTGIGFTDLWSYDISAGKNDFSRDSYVTVYPNPSRDRIIFHFSTPQTDDPLIKVFNSLGIMIYSDKIQEPNSYCLNIESLPSGIFHYQIILKDHLCADGIFIKE
ncbi:MAG: T9SS type A sorting domain-containing protein [Bacteroidetes bacterium]|nr:T9SS type A sorting domain-containing protein [Bacteroidota bacterium]